MPPKKSGGAKAVKTASTGSGGSMAEPPVAKRVPHKVLIGAVAGEDRGDDAAALITPPIVREDDLFWLRDDDRKSKAVLKHLRAENAYAEAEMAHLTVAGGAVDKLYGELKSRIKETDACVPVKGGPFFYYTRTVEGKSYPVHCRIPIGHNAASADTASLLHALQHLPADGTGIPGEEVLLDENALAAGHPMCDVGGMVLSADASMMAYAVDFSGREEYTLRFAALAWREEGPEGRRVAVPVATLPTAAAAPATATAGAATSAPAPLFHSRSLSLALLRDMLVDTSGDVTWGPGNDVVYYSTLDATQRPHRVWRHVIGTPQAADECIFEEADERFYLGLSKSSTEDYLLIDVASKTTSEVRAIPLTPAAVERSRVVPGAIQAVALAVEPVAKDDDDEEEDGGDGHDAHETDGSGTDGDDASSAALSRAAREEEEALDPAFDDSLPWPEVARPPLPLMFVIAPRVDGVLYSVDHYRGPAGAPAGTGPDVFVIDTNAGGALNFKLCVAPVTAPTADHWRDLLAHSEQLYITGLDVHLHYWCVSGRQGGYANVWVAFAPEINAAISAALAAPSAAAAAALAAAASPVASGTSIAAPLSSCLRRVPPLEEVYTLSDDDNDDYCIDTFRFAFGSPVTPGLTCEYALALTDDERAGKAQAAGPQPAFVWPASLAPITSHAGDSPSTVASAVTATPAAPASIAAAAAAAAPSIAILKREDVPNVTPSLYATKRLLAVAPDGRLIPISITYRPDKHALAPATAAGSAGAVAGAGTAPATGVVSHDASGFSSPAPLLLYGYGAYGMSEDPAFSTSALSLCDRGIVYAVAHVRGGCEMGRAWYEKEGKLGTKMNTFTDFIACAEHLVATGWTTKGRIVAEGGSAGGLLMGAIVNMRPDLWGGALLEVPFVDLIVSMMDTSLPLCKTEWEEWGNPNEKASYECMRAYCPMENIRPQAYPPMLIEAGLHDTRVGYWEAAKFAQRVRAANTSDSRTLLKVEMDEGHSGAMDRYKYLRERAREWAWVLDTLKIAA